jgi:inosine/xanthosine triphosphatase
MTDSPWPSLFQAAAVIRVGTLNAPKIEAVRLAVQPYIAAAEVSGQAVESGVPEQPVGYGEITRGARERARQAYETGACALGVGIEDGLVELPELGGEVFNVGAAVVTDGGREGLGFTALFAYPPACVEPALRSRKPIGEIFDALWRSTRAAAPLEPSGRSLGNIGRLTGGTLPRSEYGRHAVTCALIRFLHPDIYPPIPWGTEPVPSNQPVDTRKRLRENR